MSLAPALVTAGLALASAALAAPAGDESAPPPQSLAFYNARLAVRSGRADDTLTLWLLRNALADRGLPTLHDTDFLSVVWVAGGLSGYCLDGLPRDEAPGAGLWPLALFNAVLAVGGTDPVDERTPPFDAFEAGRQQRLVSLSDVLDKEELEGVRFFRTPCSLPGLVLLEAGRSPFVDLSDTLARGELLRRLLQRALTTADPRLVRELSTVEARLFDVDLALLQLRTQAAGSSGVEAASAARAAGVGEPGASAARRAALERALREHPRRDFLARALAWPPSAWLALERQRRRFLFSEARRHAASDDALDGAMLAIIDALAAQRSGEELEWWIGARPEAATPARRRALVLGARGEALLSLDPRSGFRERAPVALERGVAFLETGATSEALRSFAFALGHADESKASSAARALARRWLSYTLAHSRTSADVLATLVAFVPRSELDGVLEDLAWRAALRVDGESLRRVREAAAKGGALEARLERLRHLAEGRPDALLAELRAAAVLEPAGTVRFLRSFLERLELEEAPVRAASARLLSGLAALVDEMVLDGAENRAQRRGAEALRARVEALLKGLDLHPRDARASARGASPSQDAYAGAVRVPPVDAVPWPFAAPEASPPAAFTPLVLEPVEWRDQHGALVFGWQVRE